MDWLLPLAEFRKFFDTHGKPKTNIKDKDTKVCLLQEGADGEEVDMNEDPTRQFVLSKFSACSADDVLSAKEVKDVMKAAEEICDSHKKFLTRRF